MNTFPVKILSAERPFFDGECESLVVPTVQGEYGILAHHSNMICAVIPGVLRFRTAQGEEQIASISGGLIKVESNEALLLADSIERPEEIDANRAAKEAEEAQEVILQRRSLLEYHSAQAKMARAVNRLRVKQRDV
jgi:F-type H+-transporting ATPase subunit epsilon